MLVKYLDYIIEYYDVNNSIFKTKVELSAKVFPDKETLYNFLYENDIVPSNWSTTVNKIRNAQDAINREKEYRSSHWWFDSNPSRESDILQRFDVSNTEIAILNIFSAFIEKNKHSFSASARMFLDFSMTVGGRQPLTENRALNKIKEQIKWLPNLRQTLIEELKKYGLVDSNKEIIYEILHKNI